MIGGQMMFSIQVLDALHRLGVHITDDGADAYLYAWRVVGAMLGVDRKRRPATLAEARDFSDLYMTEYHRPLRRGRGAHPAADRAVRGRRPRNPARPGRSRTDPLSDRRHRRRLARRTALAVFDHLVPARRPCSVSWNTSRTLADRRDGHRSLGALPRRFELSSLTRGRVMHYAVPDHLKTSTAYAPHATNAGPPHQHRPC